MLLFLLPIILLYLYGVRHHTIKGASKGGRLLPNRHTIVVQQCGQQCRRAGRMNGRLIRAHTTRSKRISCKGQPCTGHQINSATSINQSKVLTKPHTGKDKPHPSTATEGCKPGVTKCRRLGGLRAARRHRHRPRPTAKGCVKGLTQWAQHTQFVERSNIICLCHIFMSFVRHIYFVFTRFILVDQQRGVTGLALAQ